LVYQCDWEILAKGGASAPQQKECVLPKKFSHFIFLITFVITLGIILSLSVLNINKHYEDAISKLKEQGKTQLQNQMTQIDDSLSIITNYSHAVAKSIQTSKQYDEKIISKIFENQFLKELGVFQLRLLSKEGIELVRYDLGAKNHIIKSHDLQDKSSRYYIQEAKKLHLGEQYLSKLDLNEENGKIEIPHKKTIRVVQKVLIADKYYYLVVNYDLSKTLKTALNTPLYNLFFVEKDGQINMHLDDRYAFSMQQHKNLFWHDFLKENEEFITQKSLQSLPYDIVISLKKSEIDALRAKKVLLLKEIAIIALLIAFVIASLLYFFLDRYLGKLSDDVLLTMQGKETMTPLHFQEFEAISKKVKKQQHIIQNYIQELQALQNSLEDKVHKQVQQLREKEQQLLQQSRLAQMGEMISMIAHQWRQPLSAISATTGNLSFKLMMDDVDNKEFEEEIALIESYAQHLSKTIDDFRDFFKEHKEKELTSLNEIVESTLAIARVSAENKNITIKTSLQADAKLHTYSNELKQVLLNLIKNAQDALIENKIEHPTITIESYHDKHIHTLIVKDNAKGISADIIDKIFDPYFSTKKEKDGTGLGLYMSKTIIQEHCAGTLSVANDSEGAIFTITLKGENIDAK